MSKSYEPAPDEVAAMGDELIAAHYPDLAGADVTIGYLMAEGGLEHNGYPAQAVVRVNKPEARVQGLPDATITIDSDVWAELSDRERSALLDHEIHHLAVKRHSSGEQEGQVKVDCAGRPELGCKKHDWQFGGFEEVARRHSEASAEVRAARSIQDKYGQCLFDWMEVRERASA